MADLQQSFAELRREHTELREELQLLRARFASLEEKSQGSIMSPREHDALLNSARGATGDIGKLKEDVEMLLAERARGRRHSSSTGSAGGMMGNTETMFGAGTGTPAPVTEVEYGHELHELPCDMWGTTIITLVKDFAEILAGLHAWPTYLRLTSVFVCQLLNLFLQFTLLWQVRVHVVVPGVAIFQLHYRNFHQGAFNQDGQFLSSKWAAMPTEHQEALCNCALVNPLFTTMILFIWNTRMFSEFKDVLKLLKRIVALPAMTEGMSYSELVTERVDVDIISALSRGTRIALITIVLVPKGLIAVILWYVGLEWLTATESFPDLFLNALALEFIVHIDEMVLTHVVPHSIRENMARARFQGDAVDESTSQHKGITQEFFGSCGLIVVLAAMSLIWIFNLQQVIPSYTQDLRGPCAHPNSLTEKLCDPFESGCFPYGPNVTQLRI